MDKDLELLLFCIALLNVIVLLVHQTVTIRHLNPMSYYILPDIRRYKEYGEITYKISNGELPFSALQKYVHDNGVQFLEIMKVMKFYLDAESVIVYIPLKDEINLINSKGYWRYEIVIREVLVVRSMPTEKQLKQLKDYLPVATVINPRTRTIIWQ